MVAVALIDYGTGNVHSAWKALEHSGASVRLASSAKDVVVADRVVLPGVGAAGLSMATMHERGVDEAVCRAIESKPVLGICLGMQLFYTDSEENGGTDCLNLLPGRARRYRDGVRVPHMGWNSVAQQPHPLWDGIPEGSHFYFANSYFVDTSADVVGTSEYEGEAFSSAIARGNLFGVQFHPEKSQRYGLRLLENFVRWSP